MGSNRPVTTPPGSLISALRERVARAKTPLRMVAMAHEVEALLDSYEELAASYKRDAETWGDVMQERDDARSALRYIEQRYGRLDGVGWERVLDA